MNKAAPLICLAVGSYWIFLGVTKYQLWVTNGPGGGLFPAIAGILMVLCSIILLRRFMKSGETTRMQTKTILLIAATIVTVLAVNIIGIIPALGLFMILWLKLYNKSSLKLSLGVGVGTALTLYLIFDVFLKVPYH